MPQNFLACEREQELLLPPSLREWLAQDHLAWCVIDAVAEFDLAEFYASYRTDGWGRAAHEPAMMVALLVYAYAIGERSSRRIERHCEHDVAFRVIAANRVPDHATIARFRVRHEQALADLFGEVLALCAEAGLVQVGVIAVDGTKVHANASQHATRDYEQIAAEILAEADTVDRAEDERYGERRGDELPPEFSTAQGRRGWLREAKRRLDDRRAKEARPIPGPRPQRLQDAKRRLEEEHQVECQANADYEAYRARGRMKDGRRFGRPPDPHEPPATPAGKVNLTDPDSRNVKTPRGWVQGYNAQAVCTENQIVIAAEVTIDSPDFGHLGPMIEAAELELATAGITDAPAIVLADAGYWHQVQMEQLTGRGTVVLIPPDAGKRRGARPGWDGGLYTFMRRVLATDPGGELYAKRKGMIEPIFADTKFNRRCDRFQRRGRSAARSEWRLITATHNLLKLHRHQLATASAGP
jgi:transposase